MEQQLPDGLGHLLPDASEQVRQDLVRRGQRLEAVGQLAGGIAHDFRNLLTAIRGYTDLVRVKLGPDDGNRSDLDQVVLAADRATELIDQLLAFSRRQTLLPRVVDPDEVVFGIAPMLRRLLGEHIALVTPAARSAARVRADPTRLEQVIVNLAVNARDAMPGGGTLTIETSSIDLNPRSAPVRAGAAPGPSVALVVSDTGMGMDAHTRERIFEPFFTTKTAGIGTGMGLAMVQRIVAEMGGTIDVRSAPGRGTRFRVFLPRVEDEAPAAIAEPTRAAPAGSETILLVEDEDSVRRYAARVLGTLGYTVVQASSGTEALELGALHAGAIDLLVTDVVLPGAQGHQLGRQLRDLRPGLRVLYVSGFAGDPAALHGAADEPFAFLQKPFSGEELGWAVRGVLDRPA